MKELLLVGCGMTSLRYLMSRLLVYCFLVIQDNVVIGKALRRDFLDGTHFLVLYNSDFNGHVIKWKQSARLHSNFGNESGLG